MNISQVKKDVLAAIASNDYGIDVDPSWTKDVILKIITDIDPNFTLDSIDTNSPNAGATQIPSDNAVSQALSEAESPAVEEKEDLTKMVKVTFNRPSDNPPPFLKIGHNFKMWQINWDEEVTIPKFLLKVIDDAVETRYQLNDNDEWEPKNVRRLSYSAILG